MDTKKTTAVRVFARQVATRLSSEEMEKTAGGDTNALGCDVFVGFTVCSFGPLAYID
ncbi:MAG: hypothetical protein JKY60_17065 [Kordiimonadaceae bacterium]|nr:hypothetical protein [Kordiimonadaceae bacterium]